MALNAYLSMVAEKHGVIRGSVTQKGREDKILVIGALHEIVSPRDPASGKPTGKRMHKPLIITKQLDRASPLLYALLCNSENIREWELQFWQPSPTGVEKQHYTVRLKNARISAIHFRLPNTKSARLSKFPETEEISFTYQRIDWIWQEGGIVGSDDWETPR